MKNRRHFDYGIANLLIFLAAVTTLTGYKVWSRNRSKGIHWKRIVVNSRFKLKHTFSYHLALQSENSTLYLATQSIRTKKWECTWSSSIFEIDTSITHICKFIRIFLDSQQFLNLNQCYRIYFADTINLHSPKIILKIHPSSTKKKLWFKKFPKPWMGGTSLKQVFKVFIIHLETYYYELFINNQSWSITNTDSKLYSWNFS